MQLVCFAVQTHYIYIYICLDSARVQNEVCCRFNTVGRDFQHSGQFSSLLSDVLFPMSEMLCVLPLTQRTKYNEVLRAIFYYFHH